jgi:hypothetical protein
MQDKYYYLISSLKYLTFGDTVFPTENEFLSECEKWIEEKALTTIKNSDINYDLIKNDDPGEVRNWKEMNSVLRGELASIRKARKRNLHEKYHGEIAKIFEEQNPLLMEKAVEHIRWNFIEEKEPDHNFDLERVILYYLKIRILTRLLAFNKEKGKERLEKLCEVK